MVVFCFAALSRKSLPQMPVGRVNNAHWKGSNFRKIWGNGGDKQESVIALKIFIKIDAVGNKTKYIGDNDSNIQT